MNGKGLALFGLGIVVGLLVAPRKGSESYEGLKTRVNDLYLQAKDLDLESVKDKLYDVKIEVSKMDYARSKEIVADQAEIVREKLSKIITDLQENEKIKPAMVGAIDATEKAVIDVITYIDENELVDKTKAQAQKAYDKTMEYAEIVKEKSGDVAGDVKEQAQKVSDYVGDVKDGAMEKVAKKTRRKTNKEEE